MNIEELKNNVDQVLTDRGMVKDYQDQTVRHLLYHLYIAIDIYRYMSTAEKNKAGYWYRIFKGSYTLRNFLKERKRKREKEKSPLHPSYKVKSGVKEKGRMVYIYADSGDSGEGEDLEPRRNAFYRECMSFKDDYDEQMIMDFYAYYSTPNRHSKKMRFEDFEYWDTAKQMRIWANNPISKAKAAADIKLKRTKKTTEQAAANTAEQQAIAAKREQENAKREEEMEQSKQNQMLTDEYLAKNPNGLLAQMARERKAREAKVPQRSSSARLLPTGRKKEQK